MPGCVRVETKADTDPAGVEIGGKAVRLTRLSHDPAGLAELICGLVVVGQFVRIDNGGFDVSCPEYAIQEGCDEDAPGV